MRVLHVGFCSYQLLTRSRLVYSGGTKINLQMDWIGNGTSVRFVCLGMAVSAVLRSVSAHLGVSAI